MRNEFAAIEKKYGKWTAHNIEIVPGLFTIGEGIQDRAEQRALLFAQLAKTLLRRPIKSMSVLDLGCLEGGISLALAKKGARCTGVDVRPNHLTKARFAAKALEIDHQCRWIEGDVTMDSLWQKLSSFDLVICSGLLYHLDVHDLIPFMQNLHSSCRKTGMVIIDSNIAPAAISSVQVTEHNTLCGCYWHEHDSQETYESRLGSPWSSLHNDRAFWLTERSLGNALVIAGFSAVFRPLFPYHEWGHQTRDIWIALPDRGDRMNLPLRVDPDPRPWAHPGLK